MKLSEHNSTLPTILSFAPFSSPATLLYLPPVGPTDSSSPHCSGKNISAPSLPLHPALGLSCFHRRPRVRSPFLLSPPPPWAPTLGYLSSPFFLPAGAIINWYRHKLFFRRFSSSARKCFERLLRLIFLPYFISQFMANIPPPLPVFFPMSFKPFSMFTLPKCTPSGRF